MKPTDNKGASVWTRRVAGAILASAILSAAGHAQTLGTADAVGVDSFKNQLLGIDFGAGTVTPRNTDNDSLQKINSVELGPSRCAVRVDAFVADFDGGDVLRYKGAEGNGDLVCDRATSTCPLQPNGLSRDSDGVLAVGDRGAGSRDGARVWVVAAESCPSDTFADPVLLDPEVCVKARGRCQAARAVVDVEFITRAIGGFGEGDLLVLTSGPTALVHYPANEVDCAAAGLCTPAAGNGNTLLVFANRSDRRPSGLALLPGGEVLVAFDEGFIKSVKLSNGSAAESDSLFATGLDPNLAGIDAGFLDGIEAVIAARRPSGEFFKLSVSRDPSTGDPAGTVVAVIDSAEIQARDAAINSLQRDADECIEGELVRFCDLGEIDLLYDGLIDPPPGSTVQIVQSKAICDTRSLDAPGPLSLAPYGFAGELGNLQVPPNIVGFPDEEGCPTLIVLEIADTFPPGGLGAQTWVVYDSNAGDILDLGSCRDNFGAVGYHPVVGTPPLWPNGAPVLPNGEGAEFGDTTIYCQNPPAGMGRENSFVVLGALRFLLLLDQDPGLLNDPAYLGAVRDYALRDIGHLITTLNNILIDDPNFQGKLLNQAQYYQSLLTGLAGETDPAVFDAVFAEIVSRSDATANLIANNRGRFSTAPWVGDALSRFRNLAFLLEEQGRGLVLPPPAWAPGPAP